MIWYLRKNYELDYEAERMLEEAKLAHTAIKVVAPKDFDLVVTRGDRRSIHFREETVSLPDLVIPRTGSGTDYYTQSVLRHLERLHVPVLNNADSIEAAKDKMYSTQILRQHNIPVPQTMLVRFPVDTAFVEKEIGFPCVIKVLSGSYGKGIHLVRDKLALEELMEFVSSLNSPLNILIQEYVDFSPGVDVRVLVVGGRVLGAMKRTGADGDFRANISRGGTGEVYPLDDQAAFIATESAKVLDLDIAGVDLLIDHNGYKVCEVNSAPGFKGFEEYCGVNVAKEILTYATFKSNKV
jgi:gamma-F420-2:alpha-L-glutamate ligase